MKVEVNPYNKDIKPKRKRNLSKEVKEREYRQDRLDPLCIEWASKKLV